MDLSDEQLLRYSRQIMLPQVGIEGQEAFANACVLVIGLGGLGSPVALYLAAAGIGHLRLADGDTVDVSNLQRQVLYDSEQCATPKTSATLQRLQALNPTIQVTPITAFLTEAALLEQVQQADIVVDCTDQLQTRLAINQACVQAQKPLVSAAAVRWEGQISVFDTRQANSPCYQCFYGDVQGEPQTCSETGVIGPLLGVMGSLQALEVLKLVAGVGESLRGKVLVFDALYMEWRRIQLQRRDTCGVCGAAGDADGDV